MTSTIATDAAGIVAPAAMAMIFPLLGDFKPAPAGRNSLTGKYIEDEEVVAPSPEAQDDDLAHSLWEQSAELVGLSTDART